MNKSHEELNRIEVERKKAEEECRRILRSKERHSSSNAKIKTDLNNEAAF